MKNCLAAKHNPDNACTDECKWPNACMAAQAVVLVTATLEPVTEDESDAVEASDSKKKPGRPRKGE
jgi:hypothetical protein